MSTLTQLMVTEKDVLDELKAIEREIIENDGEVTDELDARHDAALDKLLTIEGSVEQKIDAYGAVMTELEQEIGALEGREEPVKDVLDNLKARRKALQRNRSKMKDRMMKYLRELGKERVEGENFRFRRQSNGGRRSVEVQDGIYPDDVAEEYTYRKFDYSAIRNDLKHLEDLRGRYEQLRQAYDEAMGAHAQADDGSEEESLAGEQAREHAEEASDVLEEIHDLEEKLSPFTLGERGEHIRKF